jgi:hypothetical protein
MRQRPTEGFGVAEMLVRTGCEDIHKVVVMCPSLGWASSIFCARRAEYLGCFVAVVNFVRFALFAMEPLANDDLLRFMFAGVKGGCSKALCAAAAATFAARSDPMFVSPCVASGRALGLKYGKINGKINGKLPATQATKDAVAKTGLKYGKLPATQATKDAVAKSNKLRAGVKKVFKCGGASWQKSKSGCGAIHPSGAGVCSNTVKKLPCPADDPSCPNYVNPSKKQKSVASFFGKKS